MTEVDCRTCGSVSLTRVGSLPDTSSFAGRRLSTILPGGGLWHCAECGMAFRHPLLSPARYVDLYRDGGMDVWDVEKHRVDFDLILDYLNVNLKNITTVVDIGCYTGQMLSSLPPRFVTFGVEPNVGAARLAASRGVKILAETIDEFSATAGFYDVIVACDVIEHVERPLEFLKQLSLRLSPTGRLLVSTGNYDSWLWKIMGAKYWYCYFPEHISFIGNKWLDRNIGKIGLTLSKVIRFNYAGGGINLKQTVASLLFAWSRRMYQRLRSRTHRVDEESPPGCGATRDHMLCIFERRSLVN